MRVLFRMLALQICIVIAAYAQKKPQVAVIPFTGDRTVYAEQLDFISAKFTSELMATESFTVLDRSKMEYILQEQGFQQGGACNTSECKIQMGQVLGVDRMVAGRLVRFGNIYALHIDYIDVGTGEILKGIDVEQKGELGDVYKDLCRVAAGRLDQSVNAGHIAIVDSVVMLEVKEKPAPIEEKTVVLDLKGNDKPLLSGKKKVALAIWGTSLIGAGLGYRYNSLGDQYANDYANATDNQVKVDAYSSTHEAESNRNMSYGYSLGAFILGGVFWFWPD